MACPSWRLSSDNVMRQERASSKISWGAMSVAARRNRRRSTVWFPTMASRISSRARARRLRRASREEVISHSKLFWPFCNFEKAGSVAVRVSRIWCEVSLPPAVSRKSTMPTALAACSMAVKTSSLCKWTQKSASSDCARTLRISQPAARLSMLLSVRVSVRTIWTIWKTV